MRRRWLQLGLSLGVILCVWPFFQSISDTLGRAFWFHLTPDESLHAEVIEVLSQTGKYSDWHGHDFVPALTTGPTVVVPAALIAWLTGIPGAVAGRGVLIGYFLATLYCVILIGIKRPLRLVPAVLVLCLYTLAYRNLQDTGYYTFGILGEGAALFYFFYTIRLVQEGRWIGAGFTSVAAFLSKPYFAFLIPALLWVAFRQDRKAFLKVLSGIFWIALIWISWMIWQMGVSGAFEFWLKYPAVMRQVNGAGLPSDPIGLVGIARAVGAHFAGLGQVMGIRILFLSSIGTLLLFWNRNRGPELKLLFLFFCLHGFWWFALSPGIQARYLLPLAMLTAVLPAWELGKWVAIKLDQFRVQSVAWVLLIPLLIFAPRVFAEWKKNWKNWDSCGFCRQLAVQSYWKNTHPPKTGGGPAPKLWSTSNNYGGDLDLVLSGPSLRNIPPFPDSEFEVAVGEDPNHELLAILETRTCIAQFELKRIESKIPYGIFKCDKK